MAKLRTISEAIMRAAERTGYGFPFVGDDRSEDEWPGSRLETKARSITMVMRDRGMKKSAQLEAVLGRLNAAAPEVRAMLTRRQPCAGGVQSRPADRSFGPPRIA